MATRNDDDIQVAANENHNQDQLHAKAMRSKAVEFLVSHSAEETSFTYEEEKAVLWRIDKRVLVLVLWAYFFQQLDKSSLR
jgi:hypothetical protein